MKREYITALFRTVVLCLAVVCIVPKVYAWGQKGHDVTCAIAQRHLDCKAKRAVKKLLEGKSILYWSNWLDNASHTPEYAYTKTWHYKNIDHGVRYEDAELEPKGDVVTAIESQVAVLKDKASSFQSKRLALKMLVHLVGDLHQPMHMGHKSDLGGNRWIVSYFGKEKNLHSIWDTDVLESAHKWSHTEWAEQLDRMSRKERRDACQGSLHDWGKETYAVATQIYEETPQGAKLSYDYVARWAPVVEQRLLYGGLRLAYLLNDIF